MKKSTWVIEIDDFGTNAFYWEIYLRNNKRAIFTGVGRSEYYASRWSALRGAQRMAKQLRISAEVER